MYILRNLNSGKISSDIKAKLTYDQSKKIYLHWLNPLWFKFMRQLYSYKF